MRGEKIKILYIEDDLSVAKMIKEMLLEARRKEFSVRHVQLLADGLSLLGKERFDLVLLDLGLPDNRGLESALAVRNRSQSTPVVVLTTLDSEEIALKLLQTGVQDYLLKDELTAPLLKRALRYAIQRKRDLESLRESEQRFSSFMLHLPAAAWIKDLEGRHLFVNREAECIFNREVSAVLGKSDEELFPPETARQFRQNDARVLADGEGLQTIELLRLADGIEHRFLVKKFALPGKDGEAAFVAGVALDITPILRAEEEILRLNADLVTRAAELAAANQDLEAFNFTVAHDLRGPLIMVSSYCQALTLLCREELPAECLEYAEKASEGVFRMNRLLTALLDFSRLGRVEPHREMVDLSALAYAAVADLRTAEPGRQVDIRIAAGLTADCDPELLRVVLDNLIGNAWKYTRSQKNPAIEFAAVEQGARVVYLVRDNGVGFQSADLDKLFVPFQRLPGAEDAEGFGIGLATVERIIHRHGGSIWAEGAPGRGACFYFTVSEAASEGGRIPG